MQSATLKKLVLIGASTGGPGQISKIISSLPRLTDTSIIIAQHMVEGFFDSFGSRLKENTDNNVVVLSGGESLQSGTIYIAQDISTLDTYNLRFEVKKATTDSFNPDIDTLFHSVSPLASKVKILSVILTGIGNDGVDATLRLSEMGATCMTETECSAIVDGMPHRARSVVPDIHIHRIETIVEKICEFCDV